MTIVRMESKAIGAPRAADWALSRGRSALTSAELAELLKVPVDQVRRRLHAPARRGEWVMPVRGLWVPVPPEFRTWGAPPGVELIEAMMGHLGVGYYVGWLTAAGLYGAAHQAPQVFQVAVDRQVRDRSVGRTRFTFALAELVGLARSFPAATGRRVGWILERFSEQFAGGDDLDPLQAVVRGLVGTPSRLDPAGVAAGEVDRRWQLYLNRVVEPDA